MTATEALDESIIKQASTLLGVWEEVRGRDFDLGGVDLQNYGIRSIASLADSDYDLDKELVNTNHSERLIYMDTQPAGLMTISEGKIVAISRPEIGHQGAVLLTKALTLFFGDAEEVSDNEIPILITIMGLHVIAAYQRKTKRIVAYDVPHTHWPDNNYINEPPAFEFISPQRFVEGLRAIIRERPENFRI